MIDNYNALPLGKYIDICNICEDPALDDVGRQAAILSILADKTEDEILESPILEYSAMAKQASFLEKLPAVSGRRIGNTYKVGDVTFKPVAEIGKMTTAQYIDFQNYAKNAFKFLPELCSIFLIPKDKKYNTGYDIAEVQDLFREHLSVTDANDLIAFFLTRYIYSIKGILLYLKWQSKRMRNRSRRPEMLARIAQVEEDLRKGGDGLRMLMQLQRPADASGIRSGI